MTVERADLDDIPTEIKRWLETPYKFFPKFFVMNEQHKILDCASGNGCFQHHIKGQITSLDNEHTQAKNLVVYDITKNKGKLPFKDDEFDYVFSFETIEHIPREYHETFVSELLRISRCVVLGTVMLDGLDYINGVEIYKGNLNPYHIAEYDTYGFNELINKFTNDVYAFDFYSTDDFEIVNQCLVYPVKNFISKFVILKRPL